MAAMNIDEIDTKFGDYVYVWVRPAGGLKWSEFLHSKLGQYGDRDWRPALVSGFPNEEDRRFYNTGMDPRSVTLLGAAYGHKPKEFEFGELIAPPETVMSGGVVPSAIQNFMTGWH
jgi:hypothetical protein